MLLLDCSAYCRPAVAIVWQNGWFNSTRSHSRLDLYFLPFSPSSSPFPSQQSDFYIQLVGD